MCPSSKRLSSAAFSHSGKRASSGVNNQSVVLNCAHTRCHRRCEARLRRHREAGVYSLSISANAELSSSQWSCTGELKCCVWWTKGATRTGALSALPVVRLLAFVGALLAGAAHKVLRHLLGYKTTIIPSTPPRVRTLHEPPGNMVYSVCLATITLGLGLED